LFFAAPMIAYSAGHADRGEKLADVTAKSVSYVGIPALTTMIGAMTGNPVLGLALGFLPTTGVEKSIYRGVRAFTEFDRKTRRLECGGRYEDSATAARLRMRSIQDMSGAVGSARRFLGNEALYLHDQ
jgi:hypothetical protein